MNEYLEEISNVTIAEYHSKTIQIHVNYE